MKKGLLSVIIGAGILIFLMSNVLYHTGSPGGKTGSPGDGGTTCTQCHSGTPNTVTGWITSNIPGSGYVPGQTYVITATGTHTGVVYFGFELTAENASNQKTGTFLITDPSQTQLVNNGKAVSHTQNGIFPSGNSKSWSVHWTAPAAGTGNVTFYAAFNAANGNGQNTGDVIYKSNLIVSEETVLEADFSGSPTTVCPGGQVTFTDLTIGNPNQWQWTFEGGTPGSSNQQNPVITYDTPGTYDVTLFVSDGSQTDQITKSNYITVLPAAPPVPGVPSGEDMLCEDPANTQYTTSGSSGATGYVWQISPASAGVISGSGTSILINWADDFTGTANLSVKALNQCGESAFSAPLMVTITALPLVYMVTGGGSYCEGTSGVGIGLDGSEQGVQYELYLDGQPTGTTLTGTGDPIIFSSVTGEGTYTIMATESGMNCSAVMEGSVMVSVIPLPELPAIPQGPTYVDLFYTDESEYVTEGAMGADSYEWMLEPSEAGEMMANGSNSVVITWNPDFLGEVMLWVRGVNTCGPGEWSESLAITIGNTVGFGEPGSNLSVNVSPNPNNGAFRVNLFSEVPGTFDVSVMNLLGEVVYEERSIVVNGDYRYLVEITGDIPQGIYFLRVENGSEAVVQKFIIQ